MIWVAIVIAFIPFFALERMQKVIASKYPNWEPPPKATAWEVAFGFVFSIALAFRHSITIFPAIAILVAHLYANHHRTKKSNPPESYLFLDKVTWIYGATALTVMFVYLFPTIAGEEPAW